MRGWYHHQFWSTSQVWEAYAWTHCNLWHQVFFKMCVGVKYTKTQAWSLTHHYASAKTRKQWLHCSVTKGWVKTKGQWGQHCSVTSCMQLNDGDHYSEILEKVPPCYWRLDSQSHFLFRRNEEPFYRTSTESRNLFKTGLCFSSTNEAASRNSESHDCCFIHNM